MTTLKAGAIIVNNKGQVLLLYRGKQKDWTFPKGHIEKGEDIITAMKREVSEETGLEVDIITELPSMLYVHATAGNVEVYMFLARPSNGNALQKEFMEDALEWFAIEEVNGALSYDNLKSYFASVRGIIEKRLL